MGVALPAAAIQKRLRLARRWRRITFGMSIYRH
jgi:hypothetical protein